MGVKILSYLASKHGQDKFPWTECVNDTSDDFFVALRRDVALEGDIRVFRLGSYVDGHVAALE